MSMSDSSYRSPSRWMSALPDGVSVASLFIPGTHNSCTRHVPFGLISRCQHLSVSQQLAIGVRAVDIRLKPYGDSFKTVHSVVDCKTSVLGGKLMFDEVFGCLRDFLTANPSETVLLLLSRDDGSNNDGEFFSRFFDRFISDYPDIWFLENRFPTLGECRGRLVLMRRVPALPRDGMTSFGLDLTDWGDMGDTHDDSPRVVTLRPSPTDGSRAVQVLVQDRYMHSPAKKWKNAILPMLNGKVADFEKNNAIFNYMSTAGFPYFPVVNSRYINRRFVSLSSESLRLPCLLFFDFINENITQKAIDLNEFIV